MWNTAFLVDVALPGTPSEIHLLVVGTTGAGKTGRISDYLPRLPAGKCSVKHVSTSNGLRSAAIGDVERGLKPRIQK